MSDPAVAEPAAAAPASTGFLAPSTPTPAVVPIPPPAGTPSAINFLSDAHREGENLKEGWTENLEKAGYSRLAKIGQKYKSEGEFFKGLDHMAQFVGKKAGHLPPTAESTPEEIAEYRKQIGAPADPKEYGFKPEKLPEGMDWDEAKGAEFEALMHKHNIPAAFGKEAAGFYAQVMENTAVKAHEHAQRMLDTSIADSDKHFRQKWGADYESIKKQLGDYAKVRGFDLEDPVIRQALAKKEFVELLDVARRSDRTGLPAAGGESTGSTSPRQEAGEIMRKNPNWSSDPSLHAKVTRLMEMQVMSDSR